MTLTNLVEVQDTDGNVVLPVGAHVTLVRLIENDPDAIPDALVVASDGTELRIAADDLEPTR